MTDQSMHSAEGDVPVNPYSLMEAVNATSEEARTGWFIFLALMAYLLIAVAGISHKELLLSKDVPLPIIQVSVDLKRFFVFAPIVLCFLHFGMLMQHAMLARKVIEFDTALRSLESSEAPRHPLRLELHSYFFTQSLAGPERSPLMSFFLHAQAWLTLVVLPVLLLLYIQVSFLPYHDVEITWAHRLTLLIDIALLTAIGMFLVRSDASFWNALGRTLRHHPLTFLATIVMMTAMTLFSLFSATVPGERLDRMAPAMPAFVKRGLAAAIPLLRDSHADTAFGFRRNLVVMDVDLVNDKNLPASQTSLNLRNRDLRRARLDRSDLHQADFTGAVLDGANLSGADLRGAHMGCQDLSALRAGDRAGANCTSLRGATLSRIKAGATRFNGADLSSANLVEAHLEEAELNEALLQGANLWQAHAERAELTAASLQGANLLQAQLQGANFFGAGLQAADLSSAGLQGAVFRNASMQGAILREAELEGAELTGARLAGAVFAGAKMFGVDLQSASVWLTEPPSREFLELADLANLRLRAPEEAELTSLQSLLAGVSDAVVKGRLNEALAGLFDKGSSDRWRGSADNSQWQGMASASTRTDGDGYRSQITAFLGNLSCRPRWNNASVATGVALRGIDGRFKGNGEALYARLVAPDCPAAQALSRRLLRELAAAIDNQKGVQTASGRAATSIEPAMASGLSGPFPVAPATPATGR